MDNAPPKSGESKNATKRSEAPANADGTGAKTDSTGDSRADAAATAITTVSGKAADKLTGLVKKCGPDTHPASTGASDPGVAPSTIATTSKMVRKKPKPLTNAAESAGASGPGVTHLTITTAAKKKVAKRRRTLADATLSAGTCGLGDAHSTVTTESKKSKAKRSLTVADLDESDIQKATAAVSGPGVLHLDTKSGVKKEETNIPHVHTLAKNTVILEDKAGSTDADSTDVPRSAVPTSEVSTGAASPVTALLRSTHPDAVKSGVASADAKGAQSTRVDIGSPIATMPHKVSSSPLPGKPTATLEQVSISNGFF
ncbi:hypothetical protein V5799_026499 [Amblyomma americanum]|uniref:Uncharacterized protein n=1 Tax=Amblyomma americanum TaxID=6943 RepID=A0AAQ4DIE5_AMBAM